MVIYQGEKRVQVSTDSKYTSEMNMEGRRRRLDKFSTCSKRGKEERRKKGGKSTNEKDTISRQEAAPMSEEGRNEKEKIHLKQTSSLM